MSVESIAMRAARCANDESGAQRAVAKNPNFVPGFQRQNAVFATRAARLRYQTRNTPVGIGDRRARQRDWRLWAAPARDQAMRVACSKMHRRAPKCTEMHHFLPAAPIVRNEPNRDAIARKTLWRSGFVLLDLITGLLFLAVLAAILFVGIQTRAKGAARLAESRAALRSAEAALGELQSGETKPPPRAGVEVRIDDDPETSAPIGYKWVRITATCAGKTAELRGVVPSAGGKP
jgi:type II secretory pathway pseudopilin PulG